MFEGVALVTPYLVANGVSMYAFSKLNEKKVIKNLNEVESIKASSTEYRAVAPEQLIEMMEVLEKNVDSSNLNNLYNNLKTIKINSRKSLILMGIKGAYNSEKNEINYAMKNSLQHEFMHFASSHYDKESDLSQSGFVRHGKGIVIGKALNEGYTDLLTRRYFNQKVNSYNQEVRVAQYFELLFDNKELESLYFNNDISGLINKLANRMTREEAIKLIRNFDLGFDLRKTGNFAYKAIYTNIELKLSDLFMKGPKPVDKQFDHLHLLDKSPITNTIKKIKGR